MKTELYTSFDSIPLDAQQWNDMVARSRINSIFQRYEWIKSWWEHYGEEDTLFFLIAYEDETPVGFAPLMLSCNWCKRKTLHFISDKNADYCDFVTCGRHDTVALALVGGIFRHIDRWNIIRLINVPSQSTTLYLLEQQCAEYGANMVTTHTMEAPALRISGHEAEVNSMLNKYSLKRPEKFFSKQGELRFHHIRTAQEAEQYWEHFFQQHMERCRKASRSSSFSDARFRAFAKDLFRRTRASDLTLFSVLLLDDRPIAFHFGFQYNGKLLWYKPSFDVNVERGSPGLVLIKRLIEYAVDQGFTEFDLTIGSEPFKDRFSNIRRSNKWITVYRTRYQAASHYLFDGLYSYIKRKLLSARR